MAGDIIVNQYAPMLINKLEKKEEIERLLKENLEKEANMFVKKLQTEHKVDCLELGRIAAAKYGRGTGVDWNEVFLNSDIEVNVNIKINRYGRGDY
jgi:hypothetical protein